MGRFSYIDQVLMDYIPQKSFESPSSSPKLQLRNSDADFHDVFGGPPRRSSVHEMRYSIGETRDSSTFSGEEETLSSRSRWSALGEKPVFAEDDLNLGKYSSDDFFDDIFRGDESLCSTPRMPERDPFSSNPGSKILSPPCKSEPFGDSSPPLQFSLPAKVAKGLDIPVFASPTTRNPYSSKDGASNSAGYSSSPSDSVSKISNQLVQGHGNMRNDMSPSHQGLSNTVKSAKRNTESNRERDTGGSEGQNNNTQFHFSIYKWACKGIPLAIPLREVHISSTKGAKSETSSSSKEWGKNGSIISEPAEALQAAKIPSPIDSVLAAPRSFMTDFKNQDNSSFLIATTSDRADSSQVPEEVVPARSESELPNSLQSIIKEAPGSFNPQNAEEEIEPCFGVSDILPDRDLYGGKQKDIYASMQIEHKPNLKPLRVLFYDDSDGQGKEEMAGDKESGIEGANLSSKNVDDDKKSKKEDEKGKLGSTAVLDSPINSEDKLITNRVKRKIKEFANIFNQDAPSKSISNNETRVHSSRWKDVDTCKPEIEKSASLLKADEKEEMSRVNENKILTDALAVVNEILKRSEKLQFGTMTTNHRISNTSFERTCSGTIPESFEDVLVNIDESHCEDLQGNYLIEDLSYDQYEQTQPSKHHEEIQLSDAKIQKWSSGKEGNIRSLLSTLQYVLWPESGWKPVPLVDIIEESAVKRAYSKALLCLHPDKLQQKGAASHQKYIAEKVFEILQEAWTHFNPLGSF